MNEIFTRRSVRTFCDKTVEPEKIEQLLRAAMQAPSACNQQPWQFLVVRGAENLTKLSACSRFAKFLPSASVALVLLADTTCMKYTNAFWQQDLGAATQNILLEATTLGLGTVWIGIAGNENAKRGNPNGVAFIQNEYQLSENLLPFCVLAVGYPTEEDANHFENRFDASRVRYIGE